MSPQEAFWNSWFGISIIGLEVLTFLIVASVAIAFIRRQLRITIDWNLPTQIGN